MANKHMGKQTVALQNPPCIAAGAAVVGKKEGEGPLRERFDYISSDTYFGQKTWEKAESSMFKQCFSLVCDKAKMAPGELDYLLSGDLLNQCVGSTFGLRDSQVPFFGLYGACSTMAESLSLGAMLLDGGFARQLCCMTGSHFCSAERQFRAPLEYGGQRTPTAQWTVTGAGALILKNSGSGPHVTHVTTGRIVDAGIVDGNNMGAAMAPAAYDTLKAHFEDTGRDPSYYDAVLTGDLGAFGHKILEDFFRGDGVCFDKVFTDCGMLIFNVSHQDTHCGGSGCGCAASVLCGHILKLMQEGTWNRVLFAATGALMSPTTAQQGESIPGICHAVAIENMQEVS